jgi:hypothetical protein
MKKAKAKSSPPSRQAFVAVTGENNSMLHHRPEDWYVYAEGFKRGANVLVHQVLTKPGEWDYLVYPICFQYRHYLELKLKQIIRRGGWVVDEPSELHPEHRLLPLWLRAKTIMRKIWPNEDLARVEEVILEFDGVDPMSFAFRYPVDTKGREHLEGIDLLSVRQLARVVNEIAPYLDGAGDGIEDIRDVKAEAEHEAQQEAAQDYWDNYEPPDYEPYDDR